MVATHSRFGRIILDQNEQVGIVTIMYSENGLLQMRIGDQGIYIPIFAITCVLLCSPPFKMELVLDFIM